MLSFFARFELSELVPSYQAPLSACKCYTLQLNDQSVILDTEGPTVADVRQDLTSSCRACALMTVMSKYDALHRSPAEDRQE